MIESNPKNYDAQHEQEFLERNPGFKVSSKEFKRIHGNTEDIMEKLKEHRAKTTIMHDNMSLAKAAFNAIRLTKGEGHPK